MKRFVIILFTLNLYATIIEDFHRLDSFNVSDGKFGTMSFEHAVRKQWVASPSTSEGMTTWAINDRMLIANNRDKCKGEYQYFALDMRSNQAVCAKEIQINGK